MQWTWERNILGATELQQTNESPWTWEKKPCPSCDATSITEGGGTILAHVLNHKERLDMKLSVDEVVKRLLELDLNFVCVFGLYTNFDLLCVCMYAFCFL